MDEFYLGYRWDPETGDVAGRETFDLSSHALMVAPTGASKGVSIEIPNLLLGFRSSSVVSLDPSGQNGAICAEARRAMGHIVLPINPKRLHVDRYPDLASVGFNPMDALDVSNPSRFFMRAVAIAEGMVPGEGGTDKFFDSSARGLATWLIMYVKLRDGDAAHLGTVRDLATERTVAAPDGNPISGLGATAQHAVAMGHPRLASLASRYLRESRSNSDVIATFDAATRWLLDDDIRTDLAARNGVDFAALKDDPPKTVFAILPAGTELSFFGAWLRIVINCALDSLYARGGEGLPVIFMLSEAAQIGRLEPVLAAMGQGRKYGIRLAPIVWQDINQMRAVYGPNGAGTLSANSGCIFAFNPGNDGETGEFLSRLSGDRLVPGLSVTDDPRQGARGSISPQRERLWPPEKIRSLPERHGLVWKAGRTQPQPVYCPPYWDIEACRRIARIDPYHGELPPRQSARHPRTSSMALAIAALIIGLMLFL